MSKDTSQLILNVSGNLLGFCLIVITSLHITNRCEGRYLDELVMVVTLLLTVSNVLSFIVLNKPGSRYALRLNRYSVFFFFTSLLGILIATFLITLNFMK